MKFADIFKRTTDTEANVAQLTDQLAGLQTQAGELDTVNQTLTNRVAELESKLAAANTATSEAQTEAEKAKADADAAAAKAKADADAALAAQAAADKKKFDDAVNLRAAELAAAQGSSAPLPAGKSGQHDSSRNMPRADFTKLSPEMQMSFIKSGGQLTE